MTGSTTDRRGRGQGREVAPLSRERVVAEAVRLADADGLAGLTMRRLGDALGVEAMSLYHHVAGKEALLDAMVDVVFGEVEVPQDGDWRESMRVRAESLRAALSRHPWALAVLDSRTSPGPATLGHHDAVLGVLRGAGFDVPLAGHAFALLDAFIYGFALQEAMLPFDPGESASELAGSIVSAMPEGAFVHMREFAVERVLTPGYAFGDEFAWGLDLVLDGLAARLAASRRPVSRRGR